MNQRIRKKLQADHQAKRLRGLSRIEKLVFFGFVIVTVVLVVEVFVSEGFPTVTEMLAGFILVALAVPGMFIFYSAFGLGYTFYDYIANTLWEPHTEQEKNEHRAFVIGRVKHGAQWYGVGFILLLVIYQWAPFARGHIDVFLMLTVALPLGVFAIVFLSYLVSGILRRR